MSSADTCARCEAPLPRKPVRDPDGNLYCSGLCRFSSRDAAARDGAPEPNAAEAIAPRPWQSELTRRDRVARGRSVATGAIIIVLTASFLTAVMQLMSHVQTTVLAAIPRFLAHCVLCYFTWRGFNAARWILAVFCLGPLLVPARLLLESTPHSATEVASALILALPYLAAAIMLVTSETLRTFLESQRVAGIAPKKPKKRARPRKTSPARARR
jgi:hypothetical protein